MQYYLILFLYDNPFWTATCSNIQCFIMQYKHLRKDNVHFIGWMLWNGYRRCAGKTTLKWEILFALSGNQLQSFYFVVSHMKVIAFKTGSRYFFVQQALLKGHITMISIYWNIIAILGSGAGIAQSVYRLVTGWTGRGSNPGGRRDIPHPSRPTLGPTQPPTQ